MRRCDAEERAEGGVSGAASVEAEDEFVEVSLEVFSTQAAITDIPRMPGSRTAMVCLLTLWGNAFRRKSDIISTRSDVFPSGRYRERIVWFSLGRSSPIVVYHFRSLHHLDGVDAPRRHRCAKVVVLSNHQRRRPWARLAR